MSGEMSAQQKFVAPRLRRLTHASAGARCRPQDCGGSSICPHKRFKPYCKDCKGALKHLETASGWIAAPPVQVSRPVGMRQTLACWGEEDYCC